MSYAKSSMQLRQQLRLHTALSLTLSGTKVLKKATEELPEFGTCGGFHFMFFIYMVTLFLLETSNFPRFVLDQYEFQKKAYIFF